MNIEFKIKEKLLTIVKDLFLTRLSFKPENYHFKQAICEYVIVLLNDKTEIKITTRDYKLYNTLKRLAKRAEEKED